MTIGELLQKKGLSRYRLSKVSGISWDTLSDICSGKIKWEQCSEETLSKLARALEISMEELLLLKAGNDTDAEGKPQNKAYLETGLPAHLQKALDEYLQGEKDRVSYMDCLWGELYGSINSSQWGDEITREQADYLRKKYLFGDEEVAGDD